MTVTAAKVRDRFLYDPETGVFRWRVDRPNGVRAGQVAGSIGTHGYRYLSIDSKPCPSHRVAWLWMTGETPSLEVDHIDGDHGNNAWANLRLASRAENNWNRGPQRNSSTGLKGVSKAHSGKYQARIKANGVRRSLGYFDTAEEAHEAYVAAASIVHGEYARAT